MAMWVCAECTATYSVGAPRCPHCGATEHREEGKDMPKITVHGGPSIAGITGAWGDDEPNTEAEGGEQSSPGTSSSPSETKSSSTPETKSSGGSKRARTTGSRTKPAPTGDSSAPSTDTGQTAPTSETASDD